MVVWPSIAALALLAFFGPVPAQNSPVVMMPGVNSRSSSIDKTMRRRLPVTVRITPSPDAQLPPNVESANLWAPIYFPLNLRGMYDQPAIVPLPTESRAVEDRGMPSMVMTDDMDIDKMDIGSLRMLNSISTMEEFAAMFGVEMPVAANDSGNGIVARFGSRGTEVGLHQAICKPEEKTLVLDLPAEMNVKYMPSCVRLQRCGGCCRGSMLECRPTKTEAISIKVMRVASSTTTRTRSLGSDRGRERPGSSGRDAASRRRRESIAEIITVPEEQHIECDCQCRIQEQDCNPALQEYVSDDCRCQCRNSDEEEKCAAQPMTHYWDQDLCTCFCLKTVNCSVTLRFDHTTCSCVKIAQNLFPDEGSVVDTGARFMGDNALDEGNERFRSDRIPVTFGEHGRRAGRTMRASDFPQGEQGRN